MYSRVNDRQRKQETNEQYFNVRYVALRDAPGSIRDSSDHIIEENRVRILAKLPRPEAVKVKPNLPLQVS